MLLCSAVLGCVTCVRVFIGFGIRSPTARRSANVDGLSHAEHGERLLVGYSHLLMEESVDSESCFVLADIDYNACTDHTEGRRCGPPV